MAIVIAAAPDPVAAEVIPSVQDVADVIPHRATGGDGLARGTFDDTTVPTDDQVERIAKRFARQVATAVPGLPASLAERGRDVAALGAAAQVELSFASEDGIYKDLREAYLEALKSLADAVELLTGQDQPGDGDGQDDGSAFEVFSLAPCRPPELTAYPAWP